MHTTNWSDWKTPSINYDISYQASKKSDAEATIYKFQWWIKHPMFRIKLFKSFILHKIIIWDNDFDESQLFAFTTELRIRRQSTPAICTHCTHRSQTRAGGHITSQPLTAYLLRIATKNETEYVSECACMCVNVRVVPVLSAQAQDISPTAGGDCCVQPVLTLYIYTQYPVLFSQIG